jgi:hypothetical protein
VLKHLIAVFATVLGLAAAAGSPAQAASSWNSLSAGGYHTCAIKDGKLYCWGYNGSSQVDEGTQTKRESPAQV